MTVLIKGMEMPKNCGECQFCHTENFETWCCPTEREDILYDAIPEWCPLAEQKTGLWVKSEILPHGYYCSNCCSPVMTDDIDEMLYCPNCGAEMG